VAEKRESGKREKETDFKNLVALQFGIRHELGNARRKERPARWREERSETDSSEKKKLIQV